MNNRVIVLIALVLAILLVCVHHVSKTMPSAKEVNRVSRRIGRQRLWQGKFAPDFELQLLNGETFHLADAVGKKVIILNFFTTWCGPCRSEMPELDRFYGKHGGDPLVMIGIDCDEKEDKVVAFLKEMEVSFPVGIDSGGKIMKKYGVEAYPTTVLVDTQGKVVLYETGAVANADVSLEPFLSPYFDSIKEGAGISREAYLEGQRNEDYELVIKQRGVKLGGRAGEIAEKVYCPCGRERHLADCSCSVARRMKKDLFKGVVDDKPDDEIIAELSRKYSVVQP